MLQTPSLADVLLAAIEAKLSLVFTAAPGRVVAYNKTEQSVDVQPIIQSAYIAEDGTRVTETQPVLTRVPAISLGGGGYRTVYPVTKGDTCLIIHLHTSGDRWLARGGDIVDPGDDRRHHIGDAVALVGLRNFKHALANAPDDHMSVGADEGASIEIYPDEVRVGGDDIGGSSSDNDIVVQSALDDYVSAVSAAIDTALDPSTASPPTVEVLGYLKAALMALSGGAGWKAGTFVAKAK